MSEMLDCLMKYKTEHLFLLIGRNPLPNFVAAKLLGRKTDNSGNPIKTSLYLLHSEDDKRRGLSGTKSYADNLKKVLGEEEYVYNYVPVEPSRPDTVTDGISKYLPVIPNDQLVGLHYTGGTKAMAVHAYNTFNCSKRKVTYSYLDPRSLALNIDADNPGGESTSFPLALTERPEEKLLFDAATISLNELLALHNLEKLQRRTENPLSIITRPADVEAMSKDVEGHINGGSLSATLLEEFVLSQVLELKRECSLHDCGYNLEIALPKNIANNGQFFEIDVVAMRGYRLFAISCTLDVDPDLELNPKPPGYKARTGANKCKQKLFEIKARAEQLGGEEARVALVCPMGKPGQPNGVENLRRLMEQLKGDNIRVFGYDDLADLKIQLQDWFIRGVV